jgi:hypothetical protein
VASAGEEQDEQQDEHWVAPQEARVAWEQAAARFQGKRKGALLAEWSAALVEASA